MEQYNSILRCEDAINFYTAQIELELMLLKNYKKNFVMLIKEDNYKLGCEIENIFNDHDNKLSLNLDDTFYTALNTRENLEKNNIALL